MTGRRPRRPPAPPEGVAEVLAGSVGFLLSKLGHLTSSGFAAALAPLDLNPSLFGLLRYIDVAEGQSQQTLGDALGIPPSRIVALIDDLEARGFVERRRDPADRRVNALHLTAAGRTIYGEAREVGARWENELLGALTDKQRAQLLQLLRTLAADKDLPIGVHPALGEH
jgi:DNA-binding MarR family transcriptional regulator